MIEMIWQIENHENDDCNWLEPERPGERRGKCCHKFPLDTFCGIWAWEWREDGSAFFPPDCLFARCGIIIRADTGMTPDSGEKRDKPWILWVQPCLTEKLRQCAWPFSPNFIVNRMAGGWSGLRLCVRRARLGDGDPNSLISAFRINY